MTVILSGSEGSYELESRKLFVQFSYITPFPFCLFLLVRLSCPAGGGLRSYSYSSSRRHIRLLTVERPYSLARRLGNKRQSFTQGTFSIRPTVRSSLLCPFLILLYRRVSAGTAATNDSLNNSPLCSIARMMASSLRATATTATLRRLG